MTGAARGARAAFWATLVGGWALVAVVAWLAPLHGADWARLAAVEARGLGADARSLGGLLAEFLVSARAAHAVVAATVAVALVVAMTAHALGQLPRPGAARDTLALALTFALVWLIVPGPGQVLYQRSTVAQFVFGLAALAWVLAAYRLASATPRGGAGRALGLLVAGFVAAAASPHGASMVAAVVVAIWVLGRRRRAGATPAWMWAGLVGLAVGAVGAWAEAPSGGSGGALAIWRDLDVFTRNAGDLAALVVLVALVALARARRRDQAAPPLPAAIVRRILWLVVLAAAVELVNLRGPRAGDPGLLAPIALLIIAGVAALHALAADRGVLRLLVVGAFAVNAVAAVLSLTTYVPARHDFEARLAALAAARASGAKVATVAPYGVAASGWFGGEDLQGVGVRAVVAARFGLADIGFDRRVAGFVPAPPWRPGGEGPDFAARRGRPVRVARPFASHSGPDKRGIATFVVQAPDLAAYPELYVVHDGAAVVPSRQGQQVTYAPDSFGHHALVACDATSCVLIASRFVQP